ncbi:hypothetical protein HPB48_019483 [Haemaphysalis longicornis]|uniref:Uncharacterized protein n=1 Tax=Haemaphysalis longicornis TaxID=44386 RepID=A0A9J6FLT6_HAELO|nr:hypothetical protein HPB48_019483 [Haemaphysalis longicornis]
MELGGCPLQPDPPKSKRPSRKHRRRPHNLLAEYARRQRRHVWLETHIWHAKRFKMADLWGYRIPLQPTDKGIRAAYRGSAKHVLVHDLSYFNCIELIGSAEELVSKLSLITSADAGLTFGAKSYLPGTREGSVMLYHRGRYPFGAIGPARFLWRPAKEQTADGESAGRQLWLWVHPAIHTQVSEELVELFALQRVQVTPEGEAASTGDSKQVKSESVVTLADSAVKSAEGDAPVANASDESEKQLNKPTEAESAKAGEGGGKVVSQKSSKGKKAKKRRKAAVEGNETKQDESGVKEAPEKSEVLELPVYTNGAVTMVQLKDVMTRFSLTGPLATAVVLDALTPSEEAASAERDVWWNRRRSEREAQEAGWEALRRIGAGEAECELPRVLGRTLKNWAPVIQPSCPLSVDCFGSGWDVILPSGWGRPFWIALVYRGARASGLRELRSLSLEMGLPCFPFDHPDTAATQKSEEDDRRELMAKHLRWVSSHALSLLGGLCVDRISRFGSLYT